MIVLFDIDGTLLLSGGAGKRALNRLFIDRYGVADAFAGIRPHGMTDPAIFRKMLARALGRAPHPGEIEDLAAAYPPLLDEELAGSEAFRLMPGAADLVARLGDRDDLWLGLATGNLESASRMKLRHAGLDDHFAFGGFGSDAEDRGELTRVACRRGRERAAAPAMPCVVIGDTPADVRAAHAAGARCLAVCTTGFTAEDLKREGADHVLWDLTDADQVSRWLAGLAER